MNSAHARPLLWRMLSPLAWPFVLLYALLVRLKNAGYDLGWAKSHRLSQPVLSVGNLSLGGAGKTPLVLLLARLLETRGWSADVLSRGYGRDSQRVLRVATGDENAVEQFGDEPLLMARRGLSVYVGANRYQAGLLAEKDAAVADRRKVHILDDGFQHRQLARSVDIVLLRRTDLDDDMLPAGRLREPLCALERADICVLRADEADLKGRVLQLMRQTDPVRVWIIERRTLLPANTGPALAFCGVGDSRGYFRELQRAGIDVRKTMAFRDHHRYTHKDVERLKQAARNSGTACFVTTEKDSVRLSPSLRAELETVCPIIVADLDVALREEARCMALLESLLARPLQTGPAGVR